MASETITITPAALTDDVSRALIDALNAELGGLYPEPGATHFRLDPSEVADGRGRFLVVHREGAPVGCGALRLLDAETAELKRMYVAPAVRGTGLGRRLVAALEAEARALGVRRLVLETGVRQAAALALYRATGFDPIPLYGEYRHSPETSICLGKELSDARIEVVPFEPKFEQGVVELIVGIQRGEFEIPITAEQQPDLRRIPTYYQTGSGNFWVALSGGRVIGTIALLDIGNARAALRKMFVHAQYRGVQAGTARLLLDTLLHWATGKGVREVFLGTTSQFVAAHRFYEKHGFSEIQRQDLPPTFPVMEVDVKFYRRSL
jgi:N-acetylglutamate synthase-like GNAT family acetyltransferase